jgi:hypothetical protein
MIEAEGESEEANMLQRLGEDIDMSELMASPEDTEKALHLIETLSMDSHTEKPEELQELDKQIVDSLTD